MVQLEIPNFAGYCNGLRVPAEAVMPCYLELENAMPSDADPREKRAMRGVRTSALDVDVELKDRDRQTGGKVRPVATTFTHVFGCLYEMLLALSRLPSERGARAADLARAIFPSGVEWLKDDAPTRWSHANRLLQRIEEDGLGRDVDQLVGADVRALATQVTRELGEVIGVGRTPRERRSTTGVADKLLAFSRAVAHYCRQLAANVDESDPASIERFRRAVKPIDAYRSTRAARELDPDEPAAPPEEPSRDGPPSSDRP